MTTQRLKQVNSIANLLKTLEHCGKVDASDVYLSRIWQNENLNSFEEFEKMLKSRHNISIIKQEGLNTRLQAHASSGVNCYTLIQTK